MFVNDARKAQIKGEIEAGELVTVTADEAQSLLSDNREFGEVARMQAERINVVETIEEPQPPTDGAVAPPAPTAAPTADDEEIEIPTFKMKKKLLGNYLTSGRTPQEAALEAMKGLSEKDTTIEVLKASDPERGANLRKRVLELKKQKEAIERVTPKGITLREKIETKLPDDPDKMFEDENIRNLTSTIKKLAENQNALQDAFKEVTDKTVNNSKEDIESTTKELNKLLLEESVMKLGQYDEALTISKPFFDLDNEVTEYYYKIGELGGATDNQQKLAIAGLYFNGTTPEAEALRKKVQEAGIVRPTELEKHQTLFAIHQEREKYRAKLAAKIPLSEVEDYLPSFSQVYADMASEGKIASPKRQAQASLPGTQPPGMKKVATDIPPSMSVPIASLDGLSEQQISSLLDKASSNYTDDEARVVAKFYENNKIPIDGLLKARLAKIK